MKRFLAILAMVAFLGAMGAPAIAQANDVTVEVTDKDPKKKKDKKSDDAKSDKKATTKKSGDCDNPCGKK